MRAKTSYWLVPGMHRVELMAADYEAQRFRSHWHSGFTIGIVTRHRQGFACGNRDWIAGEGDLILLNPGDVHNGYSLDGEGWSTRMLYVPVDLFAVWMGEDASGYHRGFAYSVVRAPKIATLFQSWHSESLTAAADDETFASLTALVIASLRQLLAADGTGIDLGDAALGYGLDPPHADERTLASLLAGSGCSRTTSWRRVKNSTGLAPKELQSQLRLIAAKHKLEQGMSLVDAALDCGYCDQSHFSREFAKAYGITAGQYRNVRCAKMTSVRTGESS